MAAKEIPRDVSILILDDSPAIRARLETYLEEVGFTDVRSASDLEQAFKTFDERPATIVFLDMIIDEERGLDFAVKALEERPYTVIVLTTALPAGNDQITAAIAQGARDYLSKPITRSGLEQVLERIGPDIVKEREKVRAEDASYA